jgi:hypothetical protein
MKHGSGNYNHHPTSEVTKLKQRKAYLRNKKLGLTKGVGNPKFELKT